MSTPLESPDLGTEIVLPDGSVEKIKVVDSMRDTFITASGEWYQEDVIPTPRPDLSDPEAMEAWLDGPSWMVIPRQQTNPVTKRCPEMNPNCSCSHCYRVYHTLPDGSIRGSYHFRDNNACRCDRTCCAECLSLRQDVLC